MADEEMEPIDGVEEEVDIYAQHQGDLMHMFEEVSFREKWQRVFAGLKQPPTTGAHKWAKLQMIRLLSPAMAVVVPVLMLGLITLFASLTPEPERSVKVKVVEPKEMEELEEIEEPEIEPPEPPEPVEMEFTTDTPTPQNVNQPQPQEVTVQQAEFDSVAQVKSPIVMKGIYGSRNPGARAGALARYGGGGATETAVLRALRWLKKTQHKDGSWGKKKTAMASLAVLAYMAHGDTPASPEFGTTVEKALRFITDAQKENGSFKDADSHDYTQPIAAYALAEAYAVTKVPKLKAAAIKAVKPIISGQNPSGGFNYNLKPSERDDTSYMGWCVQALKAAKMGGLGSELPGLKACMKKSIDGFSKNYQEKDGYGQFGYTNSRGRIGLTGVGVLCLQFLGVADSRECRGGIAGLSRWTFDWDNPRKGSFVYYMYYVTQAKFQEGGSTWDKWNAQFAPALAQNQDVVPKEQSGYVDHKGIPHATGTWESPAEKEHDGGNDCMDTILCTLMLEVYYRYLPTFESVPAGGSDDEELGDEDADLEIEIVDQSPSTPSSRPNCIVTAEENMTLDLG